jgi:hypothetical protein
MSELERLYLEQTRKLAVVTAVLGVAGDESLALLESHAKQITAERVALQRAAVALCASGRPRIEGGILVDSAAFQALFQLVHGNPPTP